MTEPTTAAIQEVAFQIFDLLTVPVEGFEPGFYWNVPLAGDEKINFAEVFLDGPYPTKGAALDAARAFIVDALTDYTNEATDA